MKNVEMTVEGNTLVIKVDSAKEFGPSSSGKTIIIASTEGNVSVTGIEDKKISLTFTGKSKEYREVSNAIFHARIQDHHNGATSCSPMPPSEDGEAFSDGHLFKHGNFGGGIFSPLLPF